MSNAMRAGVLADADPRSELQWREQLSALVDGQLDGAERDEALAYAARDEGLATWELYHLVGDVLRSPDLAQGRSSATFLDRLRDELAKDGPVSRPQLQVQMPQAPEVIASPMADAANASVFRWKMVAGLASLAAVAAIGWTSLAVQQGAGGTAAGGPQLARSSESPANPAPGPVVAVADGDGQQVMIRDPRLDELLAAHKQFGSTSALQMPAGFLRNATFETPSR